MNGVLVLDKPPGVTSFEAVARARRRFSERRVGHAGTLDPMATGVLIVCLGEATKLVPYLMEADKEYEASMLLGVATDTDDADAGARVIFRADEAALSALDPARVREALLAMVGTRPQRPPRFSALKVAGRRLYQHARDGDEELVAEALRGKEREVRIDDISILEIDLPRVRFTVRCGKGTYIRAIARDVGEVLGVGGHICALRRLRVGRFTIDLASDDNAPRLFSLGEALSHLPTIEVDEPLAMRVRQGQRGAVRALAPRIEALPRGASTVPLLAPGGDLVAVLVRDESGWSIGRTFARSS